MALKALSIGRRGFELPISLLPRLPCCPPPPLLFPPTQFARLYLYRNNAACSGLVCAAVCKHFRAAKVLPAAHTCLRYTTSTVLVALALVCGWFIHLRHFADIWRCVRAIAPGLSTFPPRAIRTPPNSPAAPSPLPLACHRSHLVAAFHCLPAVLPPRYHCGAAASFFCWTRELSLIASIWRLWTTILYLALHDSGLMHTRCHSPRFAPGLVRAGCLRLGCTVPLPPTAMHACAPRCPRHAPHCGIYRAARTFTMRAIYLVWQTSISPAYTFLRPYPSRMRCTAPHCAPHRPSGFRWLHWVSRTARSSTRHATPAAVGSRLVERSAVQRFWFYAFAARHMRARRFVATYHHHRAPAYLPYAPHTTAPPAFRTTQHTAPCCAGASHCAPAVSHTMPTHYRLVARSFLCARCWRFTRPSTLR